MKKSSIAFFGLSLGLIFSGSAEANCRIPRFTWGPVGDNLIVKTSANSDGSSCRYPMGAGKGTIWEYGSIAKKPKNGELLQENLYTFVYTPKKGFKGKDQYTFKMCGSKLGSKGCVTVDADVTVE